MDILLILLLISVGAPFVLAIVMNVLFSKSKFSKFKWISKKHNY
ncbi:hypothetical protein ACFL5D_00680 [Candidatus Neomarinimicrobiota bacterium]